VEAGAAWWRRALLGAGLCLIFCAAVLSLWRDRSPPEGPPAADPSQPNLVLALVDTTRADHLGYHGYARDTSPRIDAMARESIVFLRHYSHSSRTGPALASLFTGLHPRSHGVVNPLVAWDAKGTLGAAQQTLAELLRAHGYRTLGLVANFNVSARFGFDQGFEVFELHDQARAGELNARVDALELDSQPQPFFLYLHYMDPHSPYGAPPPWRGHFSDPDYRGPLTGEHEQLDEIVAGRGPVGPDAANRLRDLYDEEIHYFDAKLGELVDRLRNIDHARPTVFVFVADHGEELLDHGSVLHGYTLYAEQLHVPLLIHDPRIGTPRRVERVSRHVDVLPTLLELLGIDPPPGLQGNSLAPWMRDGQALPEIPVYAAMSLRAVKTVQGASLQIGEWKLIESRLPQRSRELYHVASDPGERRDRSVERPDLVAHMGEALHRFEAALPVAEGGVVRLDEAERERLRALGYAN
jgi:arylsulfatase A-like enzyme